MRTDACIARQDDICICSCCSCKIADSIVLYASFNILFHKHFSFLTWCVVQQCSNACECDAQEKQKPLLFEWAAGHSSGVSQHCTCAAADWRCPGRASHCGFVEAHDCRYSIYISNPHTHTATCTSLLLLISFARNKKKMKIFHEFVSILLRCNTMHSTDVS